MLPVIDAKRRLMMSPIAFAPGDPAERPRFPAALGETEGSLTKKSPLLRERRVLNTQGP